MRLLDKCRKISQGTQQARFWSTRLQRGGHYAALIAFLLSFFGCHGSEVEVGKFVLRKPMFLKGHLSWNSTVTEVELPTALPWPQDVRWLGERELAISAAEDGVWRMDLGGNHQTLERYWPNSREEGGLWLSSRLAADQSWVAAAAPVGAAVWRRRTDKSFGGQVVFAAIVDIDVSQDSMALVGALRDDRRRFAPNGGIAWLASLSSWPPTLRSILRSSAGSGAAFLDRCGLFDLGVARFMSDGRLLIAPGFEEGLYLFDHEGNLLSGWSSRAMGINSTCDLDEEETKVFSREPEKRWLWINRHEVLDDVLPLSEGRAGLVVRWVERGKVLWRIDILGQDGRVEQYPLPVHSRSTAAHLKGDVRAENIVLLLFDAGRQRVGDRPVGQPRLLLVLLAHV